MTADIELHECIHPDDHNYSCITLSLEKPGSIGISYAKVWPVIYACLWLPGACLLCLGQNNTQSVLSPVYCSLSCGSSCHLSTSQPTADLATLPCHVHTYILQTHPTVLIREDNEHTLTKITASSRLRKQLQKPTHTTVMKFVVCYTLRTSTNGTGFILVCLESQKKSEDLNFATNHPD